MSAASGLFFIGSALLVMAGTLKAVHPEPAARALPVLGLRPRPGVARVIGGIEIAIGAAALAVGSAPTALLVALVYVGFAGFVAVAMLGPERVSTCGCFGDTSAPPGWTHVAINLSLAAVAGAGIVNPPGGVAASLGTAVLPTVAYATLAVLLLYLVYLATTALPTVLSLIRSPAQLVPAPATGLSRAAVAHGAEFIEGRVSRRGFLTAAAMTGAALVVQPLDFVLRPVSAYAAICGCSGMDCDCNDLCCDGYTAFCCTITGQNLCPPGSVAAGWWKADGSGLCDRSGTPQPRYYIDCNATCDGCACDQSGFCDTACSGCDCGCANDHCGNRKSCCTKFRYGQCGQDLECVGPIVCRVVTCTPPWFWDPSCTTVVATDNQTRFHDAACLHGRVAGVPDGIAIVGDWNGDGVRTPGVVKDGRWYLRNSNTPGPADIVFDFGLPSDVPVVGDWNGDGRDTPGVVRNGVWYLRFTNDAGFADLELPLELPDGIPVAGDWTGDGVSTPGVMRGGQWHLRNTNTPGPADTVFFFGIPGDRPVVGDWTGSGIDYPGVVRNGIWYLRNSHTDGVADITFEYGLRTDIPIAGRWGQGGVAAPGVVRTNVWLLNDGQDTSVADSQFIYGSGVLEPA